VSPVPGTDPPALAPAVPALLALLDVPVDEASWQTLDPLQRRQRTVDAVKHLLLRSTRSSSVRLPRASGGQPFCEEVFRRHQSQPIGRMIEEINPILRGWVNYFRIGHAARCFRFVKDWVERKVRRHMMRARKRSGFGWKRWSTAWIYETLRLFADYGVRRLVRV
jgi:hypothetical protein